jgi:hypothetical protein
MSFMRAGDVPRERSTPADRQETEAETVFSEPLEQAKEVEGSLAAVSADLETAREQLQKTERDISLFGAGVELAVKGGLKDEAGELDKLVGHLSDDADKLKKIVAELAEVKADYQMQSEKLRRLDRSYDDLIKNSLKTAGKKDIH